MKNSKFDISHLILEKVKSLIAQNPKFVTTVLLVITVAIFLRLIFRKRFELRDELFERCGTYKEYVDKAHDGRLVKYKRKIKPKCRLITKQRVNPFSQIEKILIKPAMGKNINATDLVEVLNRIWPEYDWIYLSASKSSKGYEVFEARRSL